MSSRDGSPAPGTACKLNKWFNERHGRPAPKSLRAKEHPVAGAAGARLSDTTDHPRPGGGRIDDAVSRKPDREARHRDGGQDPSAIDAEVGQMTGSPDHPDGWSEPRLKGPLHWPRRLYLAWRRSAAGHVWRHGGELELLHRAMGFAALGLVTLAPLLIVVAAAAPFQERGFALWVVDGMSLSGHPADAVQGLFTAPPKVLSATSAFSVLLLALFGVSFGGSVQTGYEKVWHLPPGQWHTAWRRVVWLAALTAYLFAEAESGAVLRDGWLQSLARVALTVLFGVLFFWWGQWLLLGGRVPWRALLPGAVATMLGLVGLRGFSYLVFSPLIVSNAVTYGAVGTVLVVQSWLIGVGFVVFGGAMLGRHLHERFARAAA